MNRSKQMMAWVLHIAILLTWIPLASADQFQIPNFTEAERLFWEEVYPNGGWTLYCGEQFTDNRKLMLDSIYPMEKVANHLQCESIEQCQEENGRFNRIEADLHNYYPAMLMIGRARQDFDFGEIPGEFREFFECNFEYDVRERLVEPRSIARGNIARALFYMYKEYGVPLKQESVLLLTDWNKADPPSKDERRRNDIIEELQGTRNIFIDHPTDANKLFR